MKLFGNEIARDYHTSPGCNPYWLLDRMYSDLKYYGSTGGDRYYCRTLYQTVSTMVDLFNHVTVKPEWLTIDQILSFLEV